MSEFEDRMDLLRANFRSGCQERRDRLEAALSEGDLSDLAGVAHAIAGTAGVLGFSSLSKTAQELEREAMPEGNQQSVKAKAATLIAELEAISRSED